MDGYQAYFPFQIPKLESLPGFQIAVVITFLLFILIILFLLMRFSFKELPVGTVAVIKRLDKTFIQGGTVWIIPLIDSIEYLTLNPMTFNFDYEGFVTSEGIKINLGIEATVKLDSDPKSIEKTAEELGSNSKVEYFVENVFKQLIAIALLDPSATTYKLALNSSRLIDEIKPLASEELEKTNIYLQTASIRYLKDTEGIIEKLRNAYSA